MSNLQVAETIIQQMGGIGKLRAMVSASEFVGGENFVQFSFKGSRKVNKCRVELDFATDTYTFQLWQYRKKTFECIKKYELKDVYCDMLIDLFEGETGLYLSL